MSGDRSATKKCRYIIVAVLFYGSVPKVQAQTSPVYSKHYNFEQFVNPAITGRDHYPFLNLAYKKYWIGTENSPGQTCLGGSFRLGHFDFYTPTMMLNKGNIFSKSRMGFGGFMMYDKNGPLANFYASINYAYFIPLDPAGTTELSFGLSAQISHFSIDHNLLEPNDPGDPELDNLDKLPLVADGAFGMYFHTKQFFAGMSINELFASKNPMENESYYKNQRDFFFQTGYKFFLRQFDLEPSVFMGKVDSDPLYFYGQIKAYYQNYNWIALAYRSTNSLAVSLGFRFNRIHIGYVYEQSISKMSHYFSGAHEIMLGLNIGLFEPEGIRKTVRVR
jgi:type IX secretion system PorP/SprF family membrane protein